MKYVKISKSLRYNLVKSKNMLENLTKYKKKKNENKL